MRLLFSILFSVLVLIGFSQTKPDSIQLSKSDSIVISIDTSVISTNNLNLSDTSLHFLFFSNSSSFDLTDLYQTIPNCSELIKQNGLFFKKNDTASYFGNCVILYNGEKRSVTYEHSYPLKFTIIGESFWEYEKFLDLKESKIKIISSYVNGKREGCREYFDLNGKNYKTEIFKNGKLISTIQHDNK